MPPINLPVRRSSSSLHQQRPHRIPWSRKTADWMAAALEPELRRCRANARTCGGSCRFCWRGIYQYTDGGDPSKTANQLSVFAAAQGPAVDAERLRERSVADSRPLDEDPIHG